MRLLDYQRQEGDCEDCEDDSNDGIGRYGVMEEEDRISVRVVGSEDWITGPVYGRRVGKIMSFCPLQCALRFSRQKDLHSSPYSDLH